MISKWNSVRGGRALVFALVLGAFLSASFGRIPMQAISRFTITRPVQLGTIDALHASESHAVKGLNGSGSASRSLLSKELDRQYGQRLPGLFEPHVSSLTAATKTKPLRIKLNDNLSVLTFEPAPIPHRTAEQLKADAWSKPATVLADLHPDIAPFAARLPEDRQRKVLVALAQGLKAGVRDDSPTAFSFESIQQRVRAADAVREVTAVAVEAEVNSAEHQSQWRTLVFPHTPLGRLSWKGGAEKKFTTAPDNPLQRQLDEQQFRQGIEARLLSTLQGLRDRNALQAGSGAWGKYVSESQPGLAVRTFSQSADGSALVKLNTADFADMTGNIPVRPIARALAQDSSTPEIAMLMPRN